MVDWTAGGRATSFWPNQGEPARHVVAGPNGHPVDETRSWLRHRDRENQGLGHRGNETLLPQSPAS